MGDVLHAIAAKISASAFRFLLADAVTSFLVTIDSGHHEVHEGNSFSVSDSVAANSTTVKWMIVTPDSTKYAHTVFKLSSTGEATFLLTEGADRIAGTALSAVNRKRVGTPAVATVTLSRTPTGGATDGATAIFSRRSGITGVGGKSVEGGTTRDEEEWILKPNTKYVVSITTYADSYVTLRVDFYEHTVVN